MRTTQIFLLIVLLIGNSCSSYYQQNLDFNKLFESGKLPEAVANLDQEKREAQGRNKFLYFVNQGLVLSMMGRYETSNEYFEKAYLFGEDFRINVAAEAISYFTNPMVTPYKGEDHEHLYLLYYKAINFLKLGRSEEALIECRRMNLRLGQIADKYKAEKKFQRDAFIHNLMGIIYQSTGDWNNAFIAYRNAYDIYTTDYAEFFGFQLPDQLKIDLLTAAYFAGLTSEYEEFRNKWALTEFEPRKDEHELVFFWHNGLAPVKDEWSLNFVLDQRSDNLVVFQSDGLAMSFPFETTREEAGDLRNLRVFRVAFPRYVVREPYFRKAEASLQGKTYTLQPGESLADVAVLSLRQRMVAEFSKGLLRVALKKATEQSLRKDNEDLGAVVGWVNMVTEKADTRNWQTLPSAIHYGRIPLNPGRNEVRFTTTAADGTQQQYDFVYQTETAKTLFHTFSSLETGGYRQTY